MIITLQYKSSPSWFVTPVHPILRVCKLTLLGNYQIFICFKYILDYMSFEDEFPKKEFKVKEKPKCTCSSGSCEIHKAKKEECYCDGSRHPSCPIQR